LQNSVWITPDPVAEQRALLADGRVDVESLILLEARPAAGENDAEIVAGAWDWTAINGRYTRYEASLARRPRRRVSTEAMAKAFHGWMREEREAWLDALWHDPLLPSSLLPDDYAGLRSWEIRRKAMREAGEQIRRFKVT
jgi:DNA-binding transcriptional regulator PaaX